MNVGIVVHSKTGNTALLAESIKELLDGTEHKSDYIKLDVTGDGQGSNSMIDLGPMPDLSPYDMLIFGSHPEGFSLAAPMKMYLKQVEPLSGKKVMFIMTQGLPKKWMGANKSIKQMQKLVSQKGGEVIGSGCVSCFDKENFKSKVKTKAEELVKLI